MRLVMAGNKHAVPPVDLMSAAVLSTTASMPVMKQTKTVTTNVRTPDDTGAEERLRIRAQQYGEELQDILMSLARDPQISATARIRAAQTMRDWAFGGTETESTSTTVDLGLDHLAALAAKPVIDIKPGP